MIEAIEEDLSNPEYMLQCLTELDAESSRDVRNTILNARRKQIQNISSASRVTPASSQGDISKAATKLDSFIMPQKTYSKQSLKPIVPVTFENNDTRFENNGERSPENHILNLSYSSSKLNIDEAGMARRDSLDNSNYGGSNVEKKIDCSSKN